MTEFNKMAIRHFLAGEFGRMARALHGKILDIGCGSRPYFDLYNHLFGHCITADYERRGPVNVKLDATKLPFMNACFDVVLMTEVIEHIAEADTALSEINRVLKPGGLLLITWPFNYMLHEIPSDRHRFTEFDMQSRLDKTGMRIESLFRRGNALVLEIVLAEFFASGMLKLLSRVPVFGKPMRQLLNALSSALFRALYHLYLFLTWRGTYRRAPGIGLGLKGAWGHLSLWHLGYCATVRKPGGTA